MSSLHLKEIVTRRDDGELSSIAGTHTTFEEDWQHGSNRFGESVNADPVIYGRSEQTEQLVKTFLELLQTKNSQTVVVHGESGSGKTALVEMLRVSVFTNHGYFVTGKYVQNAAIQEPHSAIMAAFSDLCDLTVQSEDFDEKRRKTIQQELGPDALQLLGTTITNFTSFIGDVQKVDVQSTATSMDLVDHDKPSFAKFKTACASFLRTMASEKHPIVIFLDDVQWADEGSRLLMEMFMTDSELKHVMFVLAYRDEESEQVTDIVGHANHPIDIALTNLDSAAVQQIVCSILDSDTDERLQALSDLVAKRTMGQPFHVIMFVEFAVQEQLLIFDEAADAWIFDIDTVQGETMVSETLADLLTRKIERLSYELKETLKVASLLGYHFGESMLIDIVCSSMEEQKFTSDTTPIFPEVEPSGKSVSSTLKDAVKAGFIEATREGYHFAHDKLQASFQSLIDEHEEQRLHICIGEAFLSQGNNGSTAYNAAVHLNCAPAFLYDSQQSKKLAQINLQAAKHCEKNSAFVNAVMMLKRGLEALTLNGCSWSEETHDLTFELMECLARNQFIIGDFEACKQTNREILPRCKTIERKIKVLMIGIDVNSVLAEVQDRFVLVIQALQILGVKMPYKVGMRHAVMKLLKVKFMLRRMSDENLLSLPAANDFVTTTAMKLLLYLCSYALTTDSKEMAVFSSLLAMEMTLKQGLSPLSPFAFAMYGIAETSLGKTDRGYRFGKIALSLLSQLNSQEATCATYGLTFTLLSCFREPLQDLTDPLFQVGDEGFLRGDIIYGSYCLAQSYAMRIICGENLERLEVAMRNTYSLVDSADHSVLSLWHQPYLQHTINMRSDVGNWENIGVLSGEIMNEDEFFRQTREANNPILVVIVMVYKATEAMYFGEYQLAASILDKAESLGGDSTANSFGAPSYFWTGVQANLEAFEITGRRQYIRKARKHMRKLQRLDAGGCPNSAHYLVYLEAEAISRKRSMSDSAIEAVYSQALARLADSDTGHLEGLLSERAGFDFINRRQRAQAEHYLQRADDIYLNEWGAIAKSTWLQEKSQIALSEICEHNIIENRLTGQYITAVSNDQLP